MNALLAYSCAHQPTLEGDFLVVVLAPPLRLLVTGAAAPLARKLRVNYGLGISGAWIFHSARKREHNYLAAQICHEVLIARHLKRHPWTVIP